MDAESWFNAKKAVELVFADEILFDKGKEENPEEKEEELNSCESATVGRGCDSDDCHTGNRNGRGTATADFNHS